MRRHVPGLVSTANLTGLIRLPMRELRQAEAPVAAVKTHLQRAMAEGEEARMNFVRQAAIHLKQDGYWLSLIGNKDQTMPEGKGPPRLSAAEICAAAEPAFEILSLQSVLKPSPGQPEPLRFWHCLMRMR